MNTILRISSLYAVALILGFSSALIALCFSLAMTVKDFAQSSEESIERMTSFIIWSNMSSAEQQLVCTEDVSAEFC